MLSIWVKFSAEDILKKFFFFSFPQQTGFDISCKLSPTEIICMKCQILFAGENKNIVHLTSAEFTQSGKCWTIHRGISLSWYDLFFFSYIYNSFSFKSFKIWYVLNSKKCPDILIQIHWKITVLKIKKKKNPKNSKLTALIDSCDQLKGKNDILCLFLPPKALLKSF